MSAYNLRLFQASFYLMQLLKTMIYLKWRRLMTLYAIRDLLLTHDLLAIRDLLPFRDFLPFRDLLFRDLFALHDRLVISNDLYPIQGFPLESFEPELLVILSLQILHHCRL